ncbi:unnamed protein product [Prunus armeniaca]
MGWYFHTDVMMKIGNFIDTTVKVDAHTIGQARDTPPAPNEEDVVVNPANFVAEIPAKMYGQWMLMKPKNFIKKVPHEQGQLFSSTKKADKASGVKIAASQFGSRFNILRDSDGRDDEDASFTHRPFGFKKASKLAAQAHKRASLCLSLMGNKLAQCDDVFRKFSFNMEGPFFSESFLRKDRLLHGHESPDTIQRVLNEAFFSGVSLTSDHMDHHGDFVDQGDTKFGIGMAIVIEQVASTSDLKKAYAIDNLAILEPRIGGTRALQIAKSLGFSNYHIIDAIGFSGGVWLLWNDNSISIQIIAHSSQSITALVQLGTNWWLLTTVYVCPGIHESFSAYFDGLAQTSKLSWLILGDFNDIVCADEKSGFSGAKFTWCNKRNAEGIVWKRLDRVLSNIAGRFLFPKAHLSHLPRSNNGNAVLKSAGLVSHLVSWNRLLPNIFPRLADTDLEGLSCKDCFLTATLPENINKTLIALVPKVERPISMTQLRPISLYNTLYKVIYKILVAQLRPCMTSLVSPNQVSFVPGRQIVDNIVVA